MLEESLVTSRPSSSGRKSATLVVSVVVHGGLLAALVIVPLLADQALPQAPSFNALTLPTVRPAAVELVAPPTRRPSGAAPVLQPPSALIAPIFKPTTIVRDLDDSPVDLSQVLPTSSTTVGGPAFFPSLSSGDRRGGPFAAPPSPDRKSTRLNSSHVSESRMPSSA